MKFTLVSVTDVDSVKKRAVLVLGGLVGLIAFLSIVLWVEGSQSGELDSKLIAPIKNGIAKCGKALVETFEKENKDAYPDERYMHYWEDMGSSIKIYNKMEIKTDSANDFPKITTVQRRYEVQSDTYENNTSHTFPSIKPGELGSPEWKEEFDKNFTEAKRKVENTKDEQQQMNDNWCSKYPDSMFCK